MNRFGWTLLAIFGLLAAAFISMTRFGSEPTSRATQGGTKSSSAVKRLDAGELLHVPVAGIDRVSIEDNWDDPRDGGTRLHHGTDIIAAAGTPVLAAAAGRVAKLFQSDRGGTAIYIRSPRRHWIYYYGHLAGYAPGLQEGQAVQGGQLIGFVGDTGNAGPGNYHLHFGMTRTRPNQHWYEGMDVDPFPFLAADRVPR